MGMPITVEVVDKNITQKLMDNVFSYFRKVDEKYSPYKSTSELTKINNGLPREKWSTEMKKIFDLCEQTKKDTLGFFDILHKNKYDPSGLVKGWAIDKAAQILKKHSVKNFYIEAGGDIQVSGVNKEGNLWRIGIRNPYKINEIVKVIELNNEGVATSGTYIRGLHIYNPNNNKRVNEVKSLTVIGPNIYDADRFATAAFAMGKKGISFIEMLPSFEGYMIDNDETAILTSGFDKYCA